METFFRQLTYLLVILTWLSMVILFGMWFLPAGAILLALGMFLFVRALQQGVFTLPRSSLKRTGSTNTVQEAKHMVTQVLRSLTRVQVAYMCQTFANRSESRAWLKRVLPRSFRYNFDELHHQLEAARIGNPAPGLKLAQRILCLRDHLLQMEDALQKASTRRPGYSVAHPVVFVITENLDADEATEPAVVTLAGWNPSQPTLLPEVDRIAFLSDEEGEKRMRGCADFGQAADALSHYLKLVESDSEAKIYAAEPVPDPAQQGVKIEKVPLGFVMGAAEFL